MYERSATRQRRNVRAVIGAMPCMQHTLLTFGMRLDLPEVVQPLMQCKCGLMHGGQGSAKVCSSQCLVASVGSRTIKGG